MSIMPLGVKITELTKPSFRDPILIQGLPGLGFVAKLAVDYLIENLKPTLFAELYSIHLTFPSGDLGVTIGPDGTFSLPRYQFFASTNSGAHLILLTGDAQPNLFGQYEVAEAVLDFVTKFGCRRVISLGGFRGRPRGEARIVYGIVDDPITTTEELKKLGVEVTRGGSVTGACGVILGLCRQRGMRCLGLLGETDGSYPDVSAAKALVQVIAQMYNLKIDYSMLDTAINDIEEKLKTLRKLRAEVRKKTAARERGPEFVI
jgi:uncharacterized protein (TIGR00162 family)